MKPLISIFGTSKYPKRLERLYRSTKKSKVSCECVFAGPNVLKTTKKLTFIKTNVKPAQCIEIAFRHCRGEFILHLPDDCVCDANTLTDLLKTAKKCSMGE